MRGIFPLLLTTISILPLGFRFVDSFCFCSRFLKQCVRSDDARGRVEVKFLNFFSRARVDEAIEKTEQRVNCALLFQHRINYH